ncbi:MAG: DUF5372 family protein [Verrucomicrobiales bacterium]
MGVLPASWTDAGPPDPFLELSKGRALARTQDLLRLGELIEEAQRRTVNENTPQV